MRKIVLSLSSSSSSSHLLRFPPFSHSPMSDPVSTTIPSDASTPAVPAPLDGPKTSTSTSSAQLPPAVPKPAKTARGRPTDEPDTRWSKTLSYILRHGAAKEGLKLRSDGFVRVAELVRSLPLLPCSVARVLMSKRRSR